MYGIVSLESGTVLRSVESESEAFIAARKILDGEPDTLDSIGVARFDDSGHVVKSWSGEALAEAARAVPA